MKKLLTLSVVYIFFSIYSYGQAYYRTKNFGYSPVINTTSGGIWHNWERTITDTANKKKTIKGNPDSVYINLAGYPNYGDVIVPDLEVKMKSLWHNDTLFFLFQRLDDVIVNGLTDDDQKDTTVAEGLDNLDATKIYFYLSEDSLRVDSVYDYPDSLISWIQFVWQSDEMQAKLPSGDIVTSYEDYYTAHQQWHDGNYYYAKFSIAMRKIAPFLMDSISDQINKHKIGLGTMGFLLEQTENDKEVLKDEKYVLQTRSFWGALIDSSAEDYINKWPWLLLMEEDPVNVYTSGIKYAIKDFAAIYPNPANSFLNIRLKEYQEIEYAIFDIMGRLVNIGEFFDITKQISLYNLDSGSYIIRLQNKKTGMLMTRKVLIVK